MFSILNHLPLVYSPLEQFDDVTWVLYDLVLEGLQPYSFYVFEMEFDGWELYTNMHSHLRSDINTMVAALALPTILALVYVVKTYDQLSLVKDFSHIALLAVIHLLAGAPIALWFADTLVSELHISEEVLKGDVVWADEINSSSLDMIASLSDVVGYVLPTQIDLSVSWDENFISFLIGFFLLGGAEEEEDEDFLLEEEEGDFIEDVVAPLVISNLGKDVEQNAALFLKVTGIFSFVLTNNLMGMLPYSDTGTSSLILTFWVALSIFASLLTLMLRKHGINYFFNLFMPAGCPLPLIFLLIPIEFISYTFRLLSLSVRLFANMMAGHTLLKVIVGFSWSMILMGDFFLLANLFPMAILFILTFLELGVALIQAYVFTILTCMYLKDIFVGH
jgi:ATP synthase subunit 6